MADESYQDRTEAPTPKRRRDARARGQVPRSPELHAAVALLAGALVLRMSGAGIGEWMAELMGGTVLRMGPLSGGAEGLVSWLRTVGGLTLVILAPVLLALAGAGLLVGGIQARGVLSLQPLQPEWERLSPWKNARRIWGIRAPVELAKSLFKLGIVLGAMALALRGAQARLPDLAQAPPLALLVFIRDQTVRLLLSAGAAYLVLALADYGFQVWQYERSLRMSKEEIRRELKETEGDQILKVRRRTMARSLARRRMLLAVSDADVVVTNPTRLAVALRYDPAEASAPVVVAMGARKMAERIRVLAREAGVPIVENRPLARALWKMGRVGFPIPVELYVAVAEVLAWVIRQREGRRTGWQGSTTV